MKKGELQRRRYILPAGVGLSDIKATLDRNFTYTEAPVHIQQRTYYDSFDWRLFSAGGILEEAVTATGSILHWRDWETGDPIGTAVLKDSVRFIWNLPSGPLRERIAPLLQMRALLPIASMRCNVHTWSILNNNKKTTVKLHFEENRITHPARAGGLKVPANLTVEPIKGYEKPFRAVVKVIGYELALKPDNASWGQCLLGAAGLQAGAYSTKLDLQFLPAMRADEAARAILLRLLDTMQVNEAGVKGDWDSEFLHDFRVAVRRTRSALGQIKGVFPTAKWARFRREFTWLGNISTPTRDLDVFLLTFDEYKNSLPVPLQEDLLPFREFLEKQKKAEQQRFAHELEYVRYHRLTAEWHAFLTSPLPQRTTLPNARRPVSSLAGQRIWRMYRRVIREGRAIQSGSPPEDLHELRKSCKKLRYLLEFFASLYRPDRIKLLVNALKSLQEQLGEYQDLHVQLASLEGFRAQLSRSEGMAIERTLAAMDLVMAMLTRRQEAVRKLFKARFAKFSDERIHAIFKDLFNTPAAKGLSGS